MSRPTSPTQPEELPPLDELPALISVPLAGALCGWSRSAAYRKAAAGHLPVLRMDHQLWVVTARLRKMLGLWPESEPSTGARQLIENILDSEAYSTVH